MGFSVASTRNGSGRSRVGALDRHVPFLHGLQEGRLRARRRTVDLVHEKDVGEDGPGMNRNVPASSTLAPRTSLGSRSGVPWTREKSRPRARLKARARSVFPTPGTSSIRTWPPANRATSRRRMHSSSTTTACRIESQIARQKCSPANGLGGVLDDVTDSGSSEERLPEVYGRVCHANGPSVTPCPYAVAGRGPGQETGVVSASSLSSSLSRRAWRSASQSAP